jgi:hypothetical protein
MANNPLQQYFRQPKVFVSLPSQGVYNNPDDLVGDLTRMPVYGMTGMDEIMLKTPDALITGESTVRVIESCCPNIKNGWAVSNLDVDALLVGIRIATYGNTMTMVHVCEKCDTENNYDLDVGKFLEHFSQCQFGSKVALDDLSIRIRPLDYRQVTDFNLEQFALQKRLIQASALENEEEKNKLIGEIYKDLGLLQNKVIIAGIEQVNLPSGQAVTEKEFITEWIENADKTVFDAVRQQVNKNSELWRIPTTHVKCDSCNAENSFNVDLDQASFFAVA